MFENLPAELNKDLVLEALTEQGVSLDSDSLTAIIDDEDKEVYIIVDDEAAFYSVASERNGDIYHLEELEDEEIGLITDKNDCVAELDSELTVDGDKVYYVNVEARRIYDLTNQVFLETRFHNDEQ